MAFFLPFCALISKIATFACSMFYVPLGVCGTTPLELAHFFPLTSFTNRTPPTALLGRTCFYSAPFIGELLSFQRKS